MMSYRAVNDRVTYARIKVSPFNIPSSKSMCQLQMLVRREHSKEQCRMLCRTDLARTSRWWLVTSVPKWVPTPLIERF